MEIAGSSMAVTLVSLAVVGAVSVQATTEPQQGPLHLQLGLTRRT